MRTLDKYDKMTYICHTMQNATVGTKYQLVIPKNVRSQIKGLKPGSRVNIRKIDANTIVIKTDPKNWVETTKGMMTEAWKNNNIIAELEKMRNDWDK